MSKLKSPFITVKNFRKKIIIFWFNIIKIDNYKIYFIINIYPFCLSYLH